MILLGDTAQLPPVGQERSPALDATVMVGYGLNVVEYELREVARQAAESGILYNATRLRECMEEMPLPRPCLRVNGFPDVEALSGEYLVERISDSYDRVGLDETIVVTRSNKRANIFNQGIRNQILYREEELTAGDLLLVAKNNYFWGKDLEVEMEAKILLDTLTSESPSLTREQQETLFAQVLADYYDVTTKREKMKRLKTDPWFNALQVKYAYGVTCHKAQGGQWKHVYVDMGYIPQGAVSLDFYRWLYTAFTRATEKIWLVNMSEEFRESSL